MATLQASGTQTATIGTEHTLADIAVAGTFCWLVRFNNHAAGDVTELRVYSKVLTGQASPEQDEYTIITGVQDLLVKRFYPIANDLTDAASLRFTLKQLQGTGRAFDWKVLKL